ncbi:MAG TPA: preprotein translocase subunit YajC [Jiangellaceae bacterium]
MEALLPLILLVAVFYFLLIRPQQKQRKQLQEVQQSLTPGSKVMTGSGLIGTIEAVEGDEVVLEVAPGVTNRFVRRAIVQVIPDEPVVPDDASGLTGSEGVSLNESNAEHNPRNDDGDEPDTPKS